MIQKTKELDIGNTVHGINVKYRGKKEKKVYAKRKKRNGVYF